MKSFLEIYSHMEESLGIDPIVDRDTYDVCVRSMETAKVTLLSEIAKVEKERATRSVPHLQKYIQMYVRSVSEAESSMNNKLMCRSDPNLAKFRHAVNAEVKKESAITVALLTSEYKKVYANIATEVLEAAEHRFYALFEEMKGRDLMQGVSAEEFDRVDEAIRRDFELNYKCSAYKDLHWKHLIDNPLIKLYTRMKKKALDEVIQPRNAARRNADAINADAQWKPDPILVAKEVERSVETLREAVSYMNNALLRKGKSFGPIPSPF